MVETGKICYNESMHELQSKLLELAKENNLSRITLSDIATMLGRPDASPTLINHHFAQLRKRGMLFIDRKAKTQRLGDELGDERFYRIPVVGAASCGDATAVAAESIEGYIQISKKFLKAHADNLLAVRASGDSMNAAAVESAEGTIKKPIRDGDYVIVDRGQIEPPDGKYVLSIIGGMANIKRLQRKEGYISLESESTDQESYPPIIIDECDEYMINGTVVAVFEGAAA